MFDAETFVMVLRIIASTQGIEIHNEEDLKRVRMNPATFAYLIKFCNSECQGLDAAKVYHQGPWTFADPADK